jgi:hypothetical protein
MARRRYGNGSITITTLSYFLTNQGLRDDRRTATIIWLVDDVKNVIFDETVHGLQSQQLTSELIREHRLQWVLVALVGTGLLFAWLAATSLLPKNPTLPNAQFSDSSENTETALLALLRHHLPQREILACLIERWKEDGDGESAACKPVLQSAEQTATRLKSSKLGSAKTIISEYNKLTDLTQAARHGKLPDAYGDNVNQIENTTEHIDEKE